MVLNGERFYDDDDDDGCVARGRLGIYLGGGGGKVDGGGKAGSRSGSGWRV